MNLTFNNWTAYAVENYDNLKCISENEFQEDLTRVIYIKKLLRRYKKGSQFDLRLLLNHVIIFYNVFPVDVATRLLFCKIDEIDWKELASVLSFFGYMPDVVKEIFGKDILAINVGLDTILIDKIKEL